MDKKIFTRRENQNVSDYPELLKFTDAIRHSYWIHTQYNFTTDIQNFYVDVDKVEKDIIKKVMLAISTIEIKVKRFWGDLYKRIEIPEIDSVGATFAESEIRHRDAYKFLLEKLGLESEFENVGNIPAIKDREDYLEKYLSGAKVPDNRIFTKTILLFSLFIEHVSLFSQFLIMLAFNKEKNLFQGVSNVVEATSIEENIHGLFGETLINIIKSQYPEWFDDEMISIVEGACSKAYQAEMEILDWIFEKGELDFLSKKTIDHFIRNRFNNSLRNIGYEPFFVVDEKELEKTEWFDLQLNSSKEDDFFYKHSVSYNKKSISVTQLDLF